MQYIVDAYNLLGKVNSLSFTMPEKEKHLIEFLWARIDFLKHSMLLVYDGKSQEQSYARKERRGSLTICYTAYGETADDYLIRYMEARHGCQSIVLVSSDQSILHAAKSSRIQSMKSEVFLQVTKSSVQTQPEKENKPVSDAEVNYWLKQFNA